MATNDRVSKWGDVSGFEFDIEPADYMNKQRGEGGGLLPQYYGGSYVSLEKDSESQAPAPGWSYWGNWMDKFEPDKRFMAVSDKNAHTYQFPEVESPWKFTEYTFQGTQSGYVVVEPPLYSPLDLTSCNGAESEEVVLKGKDKNFYKTYYNYQSLATGKIYTQEELEDGVNGGPSWYDPTAEGTENENKARSFRRLGAYGRKFQFSYPSVNSGVRLNKTMLPVQSSKMGNHANIPAHTINMSAPADYFTPDNVYLSKVIPRLVATAGSPLYAENVGAIEYDTGVSYNGLNRIKIYGILAVNKISSTPPETWTFSKQAAGIEQPRPNIDIKTVNKLQMVATDFGNDDYVHKGCQFFTGNSSAVNCTIQVQEPTTVPDFTLCSLYPDVVDENTDVTEEYENAGGLCPFYSPTGPKEIALYESSATTTAEMASMYAGIDNYQDAGGKSNMINSKSSMSMANSPLGGGALSYGMFSLGALAALTTSPDLPRQSGDAGIRWKVVYELEKVSQEDRQVVEGAPSKGRGKDTIERGTGRFAIDESSTSYGGVDTDLFGDRNMMSCARFNVNVMHCYNPDKCNPMYGINMQQGFDDGVWAGVGDEEYCRYYSMGCPHNSVPRRAREYSENYQFLLSSILTPFRYSGLNSFTNLTKVSQGGNSYAVVGPNNQYDWYQVTDGLEAGQSVYFYFETDEDPDVVTDYYERARVFSHIEHRDHEGSILYLPLTCSKPGTYPSNVMWLVELNDDYEAPNGFVMHVDNESKFFGGRFPEYKDMSARGNEVLCSRGGGGNIYGIEGSAGGGDPRHRAEDDGGYLMGYWIDRDGEWIINGRELGSDVDADGAVRTQLPPPKITNGATPISGVTSSTVLTPDGSVQASVSKAWLYSSDTREKVESTEMQELTNDLGNSCPPKPPVTGQMPTEREYYKCTDCYEADSSWNSWENKINKQIVTDFEYQAGQSTCPSCGGALDGPHSWTNFANVHSNGTVSVWGLPGQVVKTDGFYWRNPTIVNRSMISQILKKLGTIDGEQGVYRLDGTSATEDTEEVVRHYTQGPSNFLEEGLPDSEEGGAFYSHNTDQAENALLDTGMNTDRMDGGTYRDDILSPYDNEQEGLDMVTINHIKALRNRLMSCFPYTLGSVEYKDYYGTKQDSNEHRYDSPVEREWYGKRGTVPSQIMAATEGGNDNITQFWDGSLVPGTIIYHYWPTGATWWRLHGYIGGIARHGGDSGRHLDDSTGESSVAGGYTGDRIISKSYHFLHGHVPLDKEVVKAYAIFEPVDEPHCPPIGKVWSGANFKWHYHQFKTEHEEDESHGDYNDANLALETTSAKMSNDHYDSYTYGQNNAFSTGAEKIAQHVDHSYGRGGSLGWDGYLSWSGFGNDIVQNSTEEEIWKKYTKDEFGEIVEQDTMKISLSCGDPNGDGKAMDIKMFSVRAMDKIFNNETQPIPDTFDMTGLNEASKYPKTGPIIEEEKTNDTWQENQELIADGGGREFGGSTASDDWSDGGHGNANGGWVKRVVDITDIIKKKYNARVARAYSLSNGYSFDALSQLNSDRRAWRWDDSTYPPVASDDYRYFPGGDVGFWLNDPWHYPELSNDELIQFVIGDRIEFNPEGRVPEEMVSDFYKEPGVDDDSHPDYYKYHPFALCSGSNETPSYELESYPLVPSGRFWYARTDQPQSQYFAYDLRPFPIMTSHKPYRLKNGKWNVANAVCPNIQGTSGGCFVAFNQYTVSEYIEYASSHPGNVAPSLTAIQCARCGASLIEGETGAFYENGDGIDTYVYDDEPEKNVFITTIKVNQVNPTEVPTSSFHVDYMVDGGTWVNLFSVEKIEDQWRIGAYTDTVMTYTLEDNLPESFDGSWVNGRSMDNATSDLNDKHFMIPRARFIRYRVEPNRHDSYFPIPEGDDTSGTSVSGSIFTCGQTLNADEWQGGTLEFSNDNFDTIAELYTIKSNNTTQLFCDDDVDNSAGKWRVQKEFYIANCSKFEVYGYETKFGDVFVTDSASKIKLPLAFGSNTVIMPDFPTRITRVTTGSVDAETLELIELETYSSENFFWTIEERQSPYADVTYQKIVSGKYLFTPESRTIMVPTTCKNITTGEIVNLWSLNEDTPLNELPQDVIPAFISVEYFTGIGCPVTMTATAIGSGPSYQLEKDAISFISTNEFDSSSTPSGVPASDALPTIGNTVKLRTSTGQTNKKALYWHVYNHEPLVGDFAMNYIRGDEMKKAGWTEGNIAELFGGDEQTLAGLPGGANSYIRGSVSGEVVLYGSPDTLLSGQYYAYAKAMTTRKYVANGEEVVTYERTGGLKYTGFSLGAEVALDSQYESSRKGICFNMPEIRIYMKERDNTILPSMESSGQVV